MVCIFFIFSNIQIQYFIIDISFGQMEGSHWYCFPLTMVIKLQERNTRRTCSFDPYSCSQVCCTSPLSHWCFGKKLNFVTMYSVVFFPRKWPHLYFSWYILALLKISNFLPLNSKFLFSVKNAKAPTLQTIKNRGRGRSSVWRRRKRSKKKGRRRKMKWKRSSK